MSPETRCFPMSDGMPMIFNGMPCGTMIRSNFTGMVLIRLRYGWVNLNNSVFRTDDELDFAEWTLTHIPSTWRHDE